ncbi:MAG: diacylglycerol kinase family protein [Thermoanaerobaculia bacterium]
MPPRSAGVLVLNPRSGSLGEEERHELRERADAAGLEVVELGGDVDLAALVRSNLAKDRRLVVAAGGDGTIHHVIQHLVGTESVLGVIPLGSFNHFARDAGLPADWREAFELALHGRERQIDTGTVNGRHFINNLMLGVYPALVRDRERLRGGAGKWKAYRRALGLALRRFPHVSLALETPHSLETVRTQLFAVSVNSYDLSKIGILAKKVTLDDGRLSVYWLPFQTRIQFTRTLLRYLRGQLEDVDGFRRLATTRLRVDAPHRRVSIAVDGELFEMERPLNISINPAALVVRGV